MGQQLVPLQLGDVNLAPESPIIGGSQKLEPDPHRAWKPMANFGFKPRNFSTTNLDMLVANTTGSKVYDNFIVQDAVARQIVEGSPRVIRTDEEAFTRWLRSRGKPEYGTPQWTHATDRTKRQLLTYFKLDFLRPNYDDILQAPSANSKCEPSKWFSYGLGQSDHRCLVIELDVSAMPPRHHFPPLRRLFMTKVKASSRMLSSR
jgi:hypothetical protein